MKILTKIAILAAALQFASFGSAGAVSEDTELAIMAADQDNGTDSEEVQIYEPPAPPPVEEEVAVPQIPAPGTPTAEEVRPPENPPVVSDVPPIVPEPVTVAPTIPEETLPENSPALTGDENAPSVNEPFVGMPNPLVQHATFESLAGAVKFTPLYIPKKSGYTVNSFTSIAGKTAQIEYGRRWEQNVSLTIRTYKRAPGEPLQDISGIHGVKWRVDTSTGTTVFISKIDEISQAAAWAVGQYTFSAYAKNLSFAGFHALVADELVDLTTHYYLENLDVPETSTTVAAE